MANREFEVGDRVVTVKDVNNIDEIIPAGTKGIIEKNNYLIIVKPDNRDKTFWCSRNDIELVESEEVKTEVDILDRRYEAGMERFWECMKYFWKLSFDDTRALFPEGDRDYTSENLIDKIGIPEFVDRICKHKAEKEAEDAKIKVGDIVEPREKGDVRIVVTAIYDNGNISGFNETGVFSNRDANSWKKTGEHVDLGEIFGKLKELRGE